MNYQYTAKSTTGETLTGLLTASSPAKARQQLRHPVPVARLQHQGVALAVVVARGIVVAAFERQPATGKEDGGKGGRR